MQHERDEAGIIRPEVPGTMEEGPNFRKVRIWRIFNLVNFVSSTDLVLHHEYVQLTHVRLWNYFG